MRTQWSYLEKSFQNQTQSFKCFSLQPIGSLLCPDFRLDHVSDICHWHIENISISHMECKATVGRKIFQERWQEPEQGSVWVDASSQSQGNMQNIV